MLAALIFAKYYGDKYPAYTIVLREKFQKKSSMT